MKTFNIKTLIFGFCAFVVFFFACAIMNALLGDVVAARSAIKRARKADHAALRSSAWEIINAHRKNVVAGISDYSLTFKAQDSSFRALPATIQDLSPIYVEVSCGRMNLRLHGIPRVCIIIDDEEPAVGVVEKLYDGVWRCN